jgi:four helix bundle protein
MKKTAAVSTYKDLIVYQKAKLLTVDVIKYFSKLQISRSKEFLFGQLFRAISSVGANLAEGFGRNYSGSFRQFVGIARGSAFETEYWLEIMLDLEDFDPKIINEFIERDNELYKMLSGLMRKTKGGRS